MCCALRQQGLRLVMSGIALKHLGWLAQLTRLWYCLLFALVENTSIDYAAEQPV